MASLKGKKRKTSQCSPNSKEDRTNSQKQRKIDGFCQLIPSIVSRASSPLPLLDSCKVMTLFGDSSLEWGLRAQVEESQLRSQLRGLLSPSCNWMTNDSAILSESAPCQDKGLEWDFDNHSGSALGLENQLSDSIKDFISWHSKLTSQTVLAIFDQFAEVRLKLDAVINLIAAVQTEKPPVISTGCQTEQTVQIPSMVQTREGVSRQHIGCNCGRKKGGELVGPETLWYRCVGGNRRLLKEQIVLNIYNSETNVGRWTSKRWIVTSLSQLTRRDKGAIDLAAYEYLSQRDNYSRILLKFKQQLFPSLLMRMRGFLAIYQILPSQVFSSSEVSPLIQRAPRESGAVLGTADSKSKPNRESKLIEPGGRSSITKEMSVEVLEPANVKLPSIGLMQDETFDSACVETFSLLSLMEQQEVL
ncbi:hypothetical protein E2320_008629 [Naja naja]|nr:hypothetical protein E2320_008629 [Naja naja]